METVKFIENCLFFDSAQGRNKCTNPKIKSGRCNGVCELFANKAKIEEFVKKHK